MVRIIVLLLLLSACKFKMGTKPEHIMQAPDQIREVSNLSSEEQELSKSLCAALDQKRALFLSQHDGKSFDFQLEQYRCGVKLSDRPMTATLRASVGQPMIYEAPVGSQLHFNDVLTNIDGVTHFICDKIAARSVLQNTIAISSVETIQIRLGGRVASGIILEIWNFVTNAAGEKVFKDMQSIKFHAKLSNVSDFTGLEVVRSLSKKCLTDGKLSTGTIQKALEPLP